MNNPTLSPTKRENEFFSYEQWRERFLKVVLQGSSSLGLIALIVYLFTASTLIHKILAAATYAILILITLSRKISYTVRASLFLFLLYVAALTALFNHRIADASILFLGMIVMTGLLFSPRAGMYSIVAVTLVSILLFWGAQSSFEDTARLIAILFVISTLIGIGLRTFQEELTKTQKIAHQTLEELRQESAMLEQRAGERTASLSRKTEYLRATSYIARQTAEVQDLATLLNTVARLVTDQFGFYHTGIFLMNESGNQVVLQAASSEGGQRMIERGHSLSVGTQGIVGYVAAHKKPRIALDVGTDAVFFNNPDLPLTRSEFALPLVIRTRVLGVLDIQSDQPQAFSGDDIDVFQTLSDQIAIAIENARLMDDTQAAMVQLETLSSVRTHEAWTQKLREHGRAFTYTPLGLRAEKFAQKLDKTMSSPITLRGRKIGTISIARKGDGKWTRMDEGLLEEIASQVGLAVDNIRLLEEATQRARQEETISKLVTHFSQSLDLDTLLQTAARELGQLPDVSEVSVFIGQPSEQTPQAEKARQNVT